MGLAPGRRTTVGRAATGELVGRAAELAAVDEALGEALGGAFRVVLVTGSAGVGKSRLAAESAAPCAGTATCLAARSFRFGTTTSFGPWIEAIDGHLRGRAPDEVRRLCGSAADDLAALTATVRSALPAPATGPAPRRARLLDGLVDVFDNLSRERPLIVTLDDLHLADTTSWEALRYLSRRLGTAPIAVLATARPAELRPKVVATEVLLGLADDDLLRTVELEPLTRSDVAVLARDAVRSRSGATVPAVPEALVTWLMSRTLGYPLFVVTLLQALLDEGGDLTDPRLAGIPENLRDRVGLEVRALDGDSQALLEVLAVVDHRADLALLAELTAWEATRLDAALERLCRSTLVTRQGARSDLRHEVAHPIIQEAVYESIGEVRRRQLHGAVARALLDAEQLGPAAAHLSRSTGAGDDGAVDALCQAMEQAEERGLYQEALAVLAALVDVLAEDDPRWRRVLETMTWQAEWVVGHLAEGDATTAIAAMRRIEAALGDDDDAAAHAAVQFHLASFLSFGAAELEAAESACRRAVELFEDAGECERALLARNELAWTRAAAGDLHSAVELAEETLDDALEAGLRRPAAHASGTRAYVLGALGQLDAAEAGFRHSVELAAAAGSTYRVAWGRTQLGFLLGLTGRLADGTKCVEAALAADPAAVDALAHETLAHGAFLAGDLRGGIDWIEQSTVRRPVGNSRRRAWALALAARILLELDQPERARRNLEQAELAYGDRPFMVWGFWCDWARGTAEHHAGELDRAAAALDRAADRLRAIGARTQEALVLVDRAEVATEAGDAATAAAAAARLETIGGEVGGGLHPALARLGAAWAHLAKGDAPAAASAAGAAASALGAGGYALHRAVALVVRGRALAPVDRHGAAEALEASAEGLQRCGAAWRRDQALAHLGALGSRGRRAVAAVRGPEALTSRERDVARLAASGFTAREIGEQLFIGTRTVESHLAATYAKLGVSSKRELVRRAAELDL